MVLVLDIFLMADFTKRNIWLDVHYLAAKEIYKSLNNNKTPSKILHAKIKQGHFGIKTKLVLEME